MRSGRYSLLAIEPRSGRRVLMDGIVVQVRVDDLAGRARRLNRVEEADELLVPMPLQAAADHLTLWNDQGGIQERGAVALVVVSVRHSLTRLHRQRVMPASERLDLKFLVGGEHDGIGGQIDVEAGRRRAIWQRRRDL